MPLKCQARITKEYERAKADCMWPETIYGPADKIVETLPICGGNVVVVCKAIDDPYFGGCSASLEIEWICSKCKAPWIPGRIGLDAEVHTGQLNITRLLE